MYLFVMAYQPSAAAIGFVAYRAAAISHFVGFFRLEVLKFGFKLIDLMHRRKQFLAQGVVLILVALGLAVFFSSDVVQLMTVWAVVPLVALLTSSIRCLCLAKWQIAIWT
jgi:hypothetical protein